MVNSALFTESYAFQVVQDFFIPTKWHTWDQFSGCQVSHTCHSLTLCYRAKCGFVFPQVSTIQKNPAKQCIQDIYVYEFCTYICKYHLYVNKKTLPSASNLPRSPPVSASFSLKPPFLLIPLAAVGDAALELMQGNNSIFVGIQLREDFLSNRLVDRRRCFRSPKNRIYDDYMMYHWHSKYYKYLDILS